MNLKRIPLLAFCLASFLAFPAAAVEIQVKADAVISADSSQQSESGKVSIVYEEANRKSSRQARKDLMAAKLADTLQDVASKDLIVPGGLEIRFADLNEDEIFYLPEKNTLMISYSFLPELKHQLRFVDKGSSSGERTAHALRFTQVAMFLEFAHAMFEKASIKPKEKQEAEIALMLATILEWDQRNNVDSFELFDLFVQVAAEAQKRPEGSRVRSFWDKRGLVPQAPYPEFCAFIGANPSKYADLAKRAGYSEERVKQCAQSFATDPENWMRKLQPYIRPTSGMKVEL